MSGTQKTIEDYKLENKRLKDQLQREILRRLDFESLVKKWIYDLGEIKHALRMDTEEA